ncbi:MAG TPA: PKD domain-containing protein [Pyrinomonadaceae bacterium]|jgi:PKD repeat protein
MTREYSIPHHQNNSDTHITRANQQSEQSARQALRLDQRAWVCFCIRSSMLILILTCGLWSTTAFAGPVIIGGDDLDLHGSYSSGANQLGWLYIQKAIASMYAGGCITRPGNNGSIAVLGAPASNATASDAGGAINYAGNVALSKVVNYYDGATNISNFFAALSSGAANPAIIYLPSSYAMNGITTAEGSMLNTHASELAAFVNSGGGLMAHVNDGATSQWITTLLPGLVINLGACTYTGATLTPAGNTAFPGLTNANITSGPCHATFSGNLGGLSVLALDGDSPKRNLIIGGGCGTTIGSTTSCAEFSATTACQGTPTEFTDISTGATSWNWNFGDSASSTQQNPTHTYVNPGTYNVTLSVNGGACTVMHTVTVTAAPPVPVITGPASTCSKTATYCITRAPGVVYTWNVTNGTMTPPTMTATQICITVTWNATGNGMITVTGTNEQGCCKSIARLFVQECQDYCCNDIRGNAVLNKDPAPLGGGLYNFSPTLTASGNIVRVTATIISTTRTFTSGTGCGTSGPVNSYIVPPLSSVTGFTSALSVTNGREEVWSSATGVNISSGVNFPFNIQFPPFASGPAGPCPDILRFCVKYTFTDDKCHTCEIIRCYEIVRTVDSTGALPSTMEMREVK